MINRNSTQNEVDFVGKEIKFLHSYLIGTILSLNDFDQYHRFKSDLMVVMDEYEKEGSNESQYSE